MKRRVIKLGTATLVASLPSKWIKEFGIKQGDYLDVEEANSNLILSLDKEKVSKRIEIDITNLEYRVIYKYIFAAYKKGYDEIKIIFKSSETTDEGGKKVKTISLIQEFVQNLMGVEIIDQKEDYVLVKDFSKGIDLDYNQLIKRVFSLIIEMGEDTLKNIKSFDKKALESIRYRKNNVTKFLNYCIRFINKNAQNPNNTFYAVVAEELEEISDVYSWVPLELSMNKAKLTDVSIKFYSKVNESLSALFDIYCIFNKENLNKANRLRNEAFEIINKSMAKVPKQDAILFCRMTAVLTLIPDIYHQLIAVNIKQ